MTLYRADSQRGSNRPGIQVVKGRIYRRKSPPNGKIGAGAAFDEHPSASPSLAPLFPLISTQMDKLQKSFQDFEATLSNVGAFKGSFRGKGSRGTPTRAC